MKLRGSLLLVLLLSCSSCSIEKLNRNAHIELQKEYFRYEGINDHLSSICFNQDGSFILDWSNSVMSGKWSRTDEYHINLCIDYDWSDNLCLINYTQFGDAELVAFLEPNQINIKGKVFYSGKESKKSIQRKRRRYFDNIVLFKDEIGPTHVADTACFVFLRRHVAELIQNKDIALLTDQKPFFIYMIYMFFNYNWIVGVNDGDDCIMIVDTSLLRDTLYYSLDERKISELFYPKHYKHYSVKHIYDPVQEYFVLFNQEGGLVAEYNYYTSVYNATPLFSKYPMRAGGLEYLRRIYFQEQSKAIDNNRQNE